MKTNYNETIKKNITKTQTKKKDRTKKKTLKKKIKSVIISQLVQMEKEKKYLEDWKRNGNGLVSAIV